MKTEERQIVKIVREIRAENPDIIKNLRLYSYGWMIELEIAGEIAPVYIIGYQFRNNTAAAQLICQDKYALSEILKARGVAVAEHHFFMSPANRHYIGASDCWAEMAGLLEKHGALVCKKNDGTGGQGVYKAHDMLELETAVDNLFKTNRSIVILPYYEIDAEYRAIVLDGEVRLIYAKERMRVEGNGADSLLNLYIKKYGCTKAVLGAVAGEAEPGLILPEGGGHCLTWKHNLGRGAKPVILRDNHESARLSELALRAAAAVGINFASVDIISHGGGDMVLEINSGVMMEEFAKCGPEYYQIAKEIYRAAILSK